MSRVVIRYINVSVYVLQGMNSKHYVSVSGVSSQMFTQCGE